MPHDVSAAFYSLAEAFEVMRREGGGGEFVGEGEGQGQGQGEGGAGGGDLLTQMISSLLSEAETPPKEVEGVSEEFCDGMFAFAVVEDGRERSDVDEFVLMLMILV